MPSHLHPRTRRQRIRFGAVLASGALVLGACGTDDGQDAAVPATDSPDAPVVLASTTIWADVVSNVACGELQVDSLTPLGVDPHDFEPSVQDADQLRDADLVIYNGLGLEEGLEDTILDAGDDGVELLEAASLVTPIEWSNGHGHSDDDDHGHGDDDHGHSDDDEHGHGDDDHGHGDDDHGHSDDDDHRHRDDDHGHSDDDDHGHGDDDHGHTHEGDDPHVWMDPARVAQVVPAIEAALAGLEGLPVDDDELAGCAADYIDELDGLTDEMAADFADLSPEQRRLVTNHEALGYLADAFDLEVIGTVIPSTSTLAEPNARELDELAETMQDAGVTRIYGEVTGANEVAEALAERLGNAEVVSLYTESLGPDGSDATTYIDMMRTNAALISET